MDFEFLAIVDAVRIHEYVFESNELEQIRGASGLLSWATEVEWKRLVHRARAKLVYCGGGNAVARFPDPATAETFCAQAIQKLRVQTVSGSAVSHVEKCRAGESFPGSETETWIDRAYAGVAQGKASGRIAADWHANPFARCCEICEIRNTRNCAWFPASTRGRLRFVAISS